MNDGKAYHRALRILAGRPHGQAELALKLRQGGAAEEDIAQVLARLAQLGYVDDDRFAEVFLRDRVLTRGRAPGLAAAELRQKGVAAEVVEGALAVLLCDADPLSLARAALAKKFGDAPAADVREKKRRGDFLARRGFSWEVIRELMEDAD